ncbi:MAG: hypothetical protein JO266_09950 [Acidobacteria bacterium]|nr:hypothetical protein [Acidobacteriota bacterium]
MLQTAPNPENDQCRDQQQQPRLRLMTPLLPTPLLTKLIRGIGAAGRPSDPGTSGVSPMVLPTADFLAFTKPPRRFHTELSILSTGVE